MSRWKLLLCALLGHDKKRLRLVPARLDMPGAGRFGCAICFRCDHMYEDAAGLSVVYKCQNEYCFPDTLEEVEES